MESVVTAIVGGVGAMATDLLSGSASIVSAAFPVAAILIGIGFLMKAIRRVVGR